jgi:hypothetical protein
MVFVEYIGAPPTIGLAEAAVANASENVAAARAVRKLNMIFPPDAQLRSAARGDTAPRLPWMRHLPGRDAPVTPLSI